MFSTNLPILIEFLKQDLALPGVQIQFALKQSHREQGPLPMVLWQYGFITLEQLDQIHERLGQRCLIS